MRKFIPNTAKPEKCSGGRVHIVVQPGVCLGPCHCWRQLRHRPSGATIPLCGTTPANSWPSAAYDPRSSPLGKVLASGQLLVESTLDVEGLQLPFLQLSAKQPTWITLKTKGRTCQENGEQIAIKESSDEDTKSKDIYSTGIFQDIFNINLLQISFEWHEKLMDANISCGWQGTLGRVHCCTQPAQLNRV